MSADTEKKFEELGNEIAKKAAEVDCSIEEYVEGLGIIIDNLETAKDAAEDDLSRQESEVDGEE